MHRMGHKDSFLRIKGDLYSEFSFYENGCRKLAKEQYALLAW